MFTVCPKCALTLVVTAADLRVAQGYVRCGRCSSVFNALAQLTDERPARGVANDAEGAPDEADALSSVAEEEFASEAQEAPHEAEEVPVEPRETFIEPPAPASTPAPRPPQSFAARPPPPAEPVEAPASSADTADEDAIPEGALEFNPATTDVMNVFVEPPPNPEWAAATGSFRAMIAAKPEPAQPHAAPVHAQIDPPRATTSGAAAADITDEGGASSSPSLLRRKNDRDRAGAKIPDGHRAPPPASVPQPSGERAHDTAKIADERAAAAAPGVEHPPDDRGHGMAQRTDEGTATAATSSEERPADDRERGRLLAHIQPYLWQTAAVLAVLVLLAQVVHHNRDELAASAPFNRALTALYSTLGMPLVPRWDLRAYDVRQLGASVDPAGGGLMTVRASIRNSTQQPQPLPLLRVTLEDRFGNRIASRDVAPRFYLPQHGTPTSLYIAGGQRIDAEMGFADPGTNAVGFEIDACLPARGGGVTCANDLGAR
jgi:predicted Zn finger-like uncharacterized protein